MLYLVRMLWNGHPNLLCFICYIEWSTFYCLCLGSRLEDEFVFFLFSYSGSISTRHFCKQSIGPDPQMLPNRTKNVYLSIMMEKYSTSIIFKVVMVMWKFYLFSSFLQQIKYKVYLRLFWVWQIHIVLCFCPVSALSTPA